MDSGTILDADNLISIFDKLIGGIKNLNIIFLSHQDPDVSLLVPFLLTSSNALE